jgi:hypothetical protein
MSHVDPAVVNPGLYRVIFENERVRVLEYRDEPGDRTQPHWHPDSVMITLSAFRRRISSGDRSVDVALDAGETRWLAEQEHTGENIGATATRSIFIELKEPRPTPAVVPASLGPSPVPVPPRPAPENRG